MWGWRAGAGQRQHGQSPRARRSSTGRSALICGYVNERVGARKVWQDRVTFGSQGIELTCTLRS